uniref:Tick transposon n=1 Tax=Rhipicephalus appendiculatus TaxID=34631 RepID=A0A131YJD4_RHIAP
MTIVFSLVIELQVHAIMDFIVSQRDMVLEDGVPFLQDNFVPSRSRLRGYEFLQISNSVVVVALYPNLFPQSVVARNFNHYD